MLIDGLTVAAQIVNFLLLVWLLKRFLYRRILEAIDTREKGIAANLAEATAREKEAAEHLAVYQAQLHDFEQQHARLLAEAKAEAAKRYEELLEKAQHDVSALEEQWRREFETERTALLLEFRRRVAGEVLALTRRTVQDLACLDVQECAVRAFLEKIRTLGDDSRQALAQGGLLLQTTFDLPEETREQIHRALEDRLQAQVPLRFERTGDLGLGLELSGNGWRVGWNADSYLEALGEELLNSLEGAPDASAKAGAS